MGNYNYKNLKEDEVIKKFNEEARKNQQGWLEADKEGSNEKKEYYHNKQKENVKAYDEVTGGESSYDPFTGKWDLSDGRRTEIDGVKGNSFLSPHYSFGKEKEYERYKELEDEYDDAEFSYDSDEDKLYKNYERKYEEKGKKAMDDTIAKASSKTGGMASSYAVTAGNMAYNDYMQELSDKIPELEKLAYQKFKDEQDKLLEQIERAEKDMERKREEHYENYEAYSDGKKSENKLNVALIKAASYGYDSLSQDEMEAIYDAGAYYDPETKTIVDREGNVFATGVGEDALFNSAMISAQDTGWKSLTSSEQQAIYEKGVRYDPITKTLIDSKGNVYRTGINLIK